MKLTKFITTIFSLVALFGLSACDDSFPIGDLANNSDRIVVEGTFTNENRVQTIYISRTLAFTKSSPDGNSFPQLTGAQVSVSDDQGNTFSFIEQTPGVYATSGAVQGVVGRSYTLTIVTSDGKQYVSTPEQMQEVAPIKALEVTDSEEGNNGLGTEIEDTGKVINLTFNDPAGVNNYYRWHWKESTTNNFTAIDSSFSNAYDEDRFFDGTELKFDLTNVQKNDTRYVQIHQTAITSGAFDFLQQISTQQESGLGPFSPTPSPVRGNITNRNDSRDFALGYFMVASVTSSTVEITQ
ncbi:hypothetical protein BKI52_09000 [marine bacterium AO1-C]|nr:hypothetical protein BKI52_09000 [marine bacterium AO1-C]